MIFPAVLVRERPILVERENIAQGSTANRLCIFKMATIGPTRRFAAVLWRFCLLLLFV
jgi:hypothetical protein